MAPRTSSRLNLIFDADDTLWDSNIHFLDAFEEFARVLTSTAMHLDRAACHAAVRRAELELIQTYGYGRGPYIMALHRAAEEIAPGESRAVVRREIERIGDALIARRCELLPGVAETIALLAGRHRLLLFTKGQREEQLAKLEYSGLAPMFARVETPREKNDDAYRALILDADLAPDATYMIGNSPRSDINPSVRAGLRAVFIPHPHTWDLEQEEIAVPSDRVIKLDSFRRLLELF